MAESSRVTYGHIRRLLLDLGFADESVEGSHRAFRHAGSKTLIVLALRPERDRAREADIASVRRHLVENGLIELRDFQQRLRAAVRA